MKFLIINSGSNRESYCPECGSSYVVAEFSAKILCTECGLQFQCCLSKTKMWLFYEGPSLIELDNEPCIEKLTLAQVREYCQRKKIHKALYYLGRVPPSFIRQEFHYFLVAVGKCKGVEEVVCSECRQIIHDNDTHLTDIQDELVDQMFQYYGIEKDSQNYDISALPESAQLLFIPPEHYLLPSSFFDKTISLTIEPEQQAKKI